MNPSEPTTWDEVPPAVRAGLAEYGRLAKAAADARDHLAEAMAAANNPVSALVSGAAAYGDRHRPEIGAALKDALKTVAGGANEAGFPPPPPGPYADPKGYTGIPGLTHLADATGWSAGPINAHWGGPRPVANALVGAGLGAAAGYGLGRIAEMTGRFEPGTPRRRLAYLGAALGSVPGIAQGVDNVMSGGTPLDVWPAKRAAAWRVPGSDVFDPFIPRDELVEALMADAATPGVIRASAAGLLEAASAVRGGSPLVSPWDVARVAISTGSGAAQGLALGRVLGTMAGLDPKTRRDLQEAGWWAGLLRAAVPPAMNRPPV